MPKNVKGGSFGLFNIQFVAKYLKIEGYPLEALKNFRKSRLMDIACWATGSYVKKWTIQCEIVI